jgi:hypothetical protein
MAPVLSTQRVAGSIVQLVGPRRSRSVRLRRPRVRGGSCRVGVSRSDAHRNRTVAPPARLALRVELGLRFGFALHLLQAAGLTQRCADVAAPLFADPSSRMGERLLLLWCELRFVVGHFRGPTRLLVLWCSRNRMLNHGEFEYRRVRTQTHARRVSSRWSCRWRSATVASVNLDDLESALNPGSGCRLQGTRHSLSEECGGSVVVAHFDAHLEKQE